MKFLLPSLLFLFFHSLQADNTQADTIAKKFIKSIESNKLEDVLKMYITTEEIKKQLENPPPGAPVPPKELIPKILKRFQDLDSKNNERIPNFLKEFKKLKGFNYKEASGDVRKTPEGNMIPFLKIVFESKEKETFSLDLGTVAEINGEWKFVKEFPDLMFIKRVNNPPLSIGFESKNSSIQTTMTTFSEITNGAMGSHLITIVCQSCGPKGFKEKFMKINHEEKHLKGGILGIPWHTLTEKQGLKREKLKLKSVKDISETEVIATFASSTHEIVGPMVLENNRWLFAMGKAQVYILKDGKKTSVDLSKL